MAFSAHKDKKAMEEIVDSPQEVDAKAKQLADLILKSRHFIAFTGAGISTACGIPDFRGPTGVWTLRAQGKTSSGGTSSTKAVPSYSHMALVSMVNNGNLKKVVSQNTDGLHRKSGLSADQVCELHGNTNLEICVKCDREYLRDCRVRQAQKVHEHYTGRTCDDPECGGKLKDTIINFGECLNSNVIAEGERHGAAADLCLVLGSSLTVTPAADIPGEVGKRGRNLVIVNLQRTPLDKLASIRVHSKIDDFMERVMRYLHLPVPKWNLRRCITLTAYPSKKVAGGTVVRVTDSDEHGRPYVFAKGATITPARASPASRSDQVAMARKVGHPHSGTLKSPETAAKALVQIEFNGNYSEPPATVPLASLMETYNGESEVSTKVELLYDVTTREWSQMAVDEFRHRPYANPEVADSFKKLREEAKAGRPAQAPAEEPVRAQKESNPVNQINLIEIGG